jgi:hypothetical protein
MSIQLIKDGDQWRRQLATYPENAPDLFLEHGIMNITLNLVPIVSLIAGILILIIPRLLNMIVAIYLILIGLVGLFGTGHFLR